MLFDFYLFIFILTQLPAFRVQQIYGLYSRMDTLIREGNNPTHFGERTRTLPFSGSLTLEGPPPPDFALRPGLSITDLLCPTCGLQIAGLHWAAQCRLYR